MKEKLAPENTGRTLIQAGSILTGYELVKASILDGVAGFFSFNWDDKGKPIPDENYKTDVLARGHNKWSGSCSWLVHMGALTETQVETLNDVREHRSALAHELARFLVDPDVEVDLKLLAALRGIMKSLDRFWGSIEVDINPDLDGQRDEIDYDGIKSGGGLILDYVCTLAGLEDNTSQI